MTPRSGQVLVYDYMCVISENIHVFKHIVKSRTLQKNVKHI